MSSDVCRPSGVNLIPCSARFFRIATVIVLLPLFASADVNVTINAGKPLSVLSDATYGMHTSVYDNQNGNANLPGRLLQSGINTLRYSGGGYADVYHWSVHKLSPWQDGSYGYLGPNTDFGKFVQLLDNAQCQAVITINFGSGQLWNGAHTQLNAPTTNGQPQEAAAWVAYANASTNDFIYGSANDLALGVDALGNDWKTVGFWARLRASTVSQYQSWAGAAYDSTFDFLAINHPAPVGIKYWEIGNETFGTGYYDGSDGYSVNYAVPYDGTARLGHPSLSPATYGQSVNVFAQAMKAVDPTIKIGAVVSTPPGDYSWDNYSGKRWSTEVLGQCAANVDFIIAHWYSYAGENAGPSNLLSYVRSVLPTMVNGASTNLNTGTSAGLRDWINTYRPADGSNVQMFITEFGYFGSLTNTWLGSGNALYAADSYATWMDLGVANIDYLEMNKAPFLGDGSSLTRGAVYYSLQTLRKAAGPGDTMLQASSSQELLRVHAALQLSNKLGLVLINEDMTNGQTVDVTITNLNVGASGLRYQFGKGNFPASSQTPNSPPSTNAVSGLGNSFSVTVPAFTMVVLVIPTLSDSPPEAPAGLVAVPSDSQVSLSWNAAATATNYFVKRSLDAGGNYSAIATNGTNLIFLDTGLVNGTVYYYVVSASNTAGESEGSAEVSTRALSAAPVEFSINSAPGQFELYWPPDHTGWWLMAQTNDPGSGLSSNWTYVDGSSETNFMMLSFDVLHGSVFFRLMHP